MKKLVLFGTGQYGKLWLDELGYKNVYAFSTTNKNEWGTTIFNKQVLSVEGLVREREEISIYISTGWRSHYEIYYYLQCFGLTDCIVPYPIDNKNINYESNHFICNPKTQFGGFNYFGNNISFTDSKVGIGTYFVGNKNIIDYIDISVGNFCSIGSNFKIIYGSHPTNFVSTHPSFYTTNNITSSFVFVEKQKYNEHRCCNNNRRAEIENDVWIGDDVSVLEGVKIGNGAVIGAGSMIVKDIPPYAIVAGNPAKLIRYRFAEDVIDKLLLLEWWNKDIDWIKKHAKYYEDIDLFLKNI